MAKTVEQLQAIRDKIIDQMDNPDSVTGPDGAGVKFRSQSDLRAALADIDREINAVAGVTPGRVFTVQTSRGIS